MHWTLYILVKGVITKAAHLYRGGQIKLWDVPAEEAAKGETMLLELGTTQWLADSMQ